MKSSIRFDFDILTNISWTYLFASWPLRFFFLFSSLPNIWFECRMVSNGYLPFRIPHSFHPARRLCMESNASSPYIGCQSDQSGTILFMWPINHKYAESWESLDFYCPVREGNSSLITRNRQTPPHPSPPSSSHLEVAKTPKWVIHQSGDIFRLVSGLRNDIRRT